MFDDKLQSVLDSVRGSEAAIVMGFDGIPVDSAGKTQENDIETIGMEFSVVLKEVRKAAELLETGPAEELLIRTDKMATVLRVVNDEYFVALTLSPGGNVGKARYILKMLTPEFNAELT